MRKVTFIIDDMEYLRNLYKKELTEEQFNNIKGDLKPFKAIFTLTGDKYPDRYTLTTPEGEKLNINDLNGYQTGCILGDCYSYYEGKGYCHKTESPCGVVEIKEEAV